jgi:fructose-1,6-bisphosphatase I
MLVYTAGNGVNGFTLDPTIGEFLLSHEDMRFGEGCRVLSYNVSNLGRWPAYARRYVDYLNSGEHERCAKSTNRYIGSLVADFHRNLLYGGVFLYPEDDKNPKGKLRVLYECNPLAFLAEQAGGAASDGRRRIMEIDPQNLHERTPFIVGSEPEVKLYESFCREAESSAER